MEITDLMVGDWVRIIEPDPHHGHLAQVLCIGGVNNYITVNIPNQHNKDVFIEDVEPVLITKEILEKNGFKMLCREPIGRITFIHFYEIIATIENGAWFFSVGPVGSLKKRFIEFSCAEYVHEMQHILQQGKVKMKIELC